MAVFHFPGCQQEGEDDFVLLTHVDGDLSVFNRALPLPEVIHFYLFFLLALLKFSISSLDTFEIIVPNNPVVGVAGKSLILPCRISPTLSAVDMEITWSRNSELIYGYSSGAEKFDDQYWKGRVGLFTDELQNGNVSLRLQDVRVSDLGSYTCNSRFSSFHNILELRFGEEPRLFLDSPPGNEIKLKCESQGWFPKPVLRWGTLMGQDLTTRADTTENEDKVSLVGVSSTLWVTERDRHGVICVIQHSETKSSIQCGCISLTVVMLYVVSHVTLDPDTAHPHLVVSADGRRVRDQHKDQNVPDTPLRFDTWCFVLGRESFTSGQHYWEVDVKDKTDWYLGVISESAQRKTRVSLKPWSGYWIVRLNSDELTALTDPETPLRLRAIPQKVGVYLDCDEGRLSFYNVEDRWHIYTFNGGVTGKLYPLFEPGMEGEELKILQPGDKTNHSDQHKEVV
uniref:Butyrophilin subfamily 1 member A1-like n=1 Tax=Erpetoichthys calabaricus TaxID=27687 RepID=A0A8C4XFL1_ERPCA